MPRPLTSSEEITLELQKAANPAIAEHSKRFFKTGPGEYGEGDVFRGIRVPVLRKMAARSKSLTLVEATQLLHSRFHEDRLLALFILVQLFGKAKNRESVYKEYLANTAFINNWDLVDSSAHQIVGGFLFDKDRSVLYSLAKSPMLWERRISMIATYHFIRKNDFKDTFVLAKMLLKDPEDLMHKAVGWMIREVGNRNRDAATGFLNQHYMDMPRTMLRYAIEKYPETERQAYLKGTI